ncbi:hypothetical protein MTP99_002559 [Tenebrio molitor]|nr:hypothetical protein MTP99_002559 [Tenebrio molitor]CAH1378755.1 unnamed protein product [Tenebrio molitor]
MGDIRFVKTYLYRYNLYVTVSIPQKVSAATGDPQEECTRCGKMYICNGTPEVCPKCRGQNNAPHGDSAEDSSGNHTEDSNTPE